MLLNNKINKINNYKIIKCTKEEYIYYKLKYEDANYKVYPLYYLGGTRDFGFHKQKITCNNLWNPHTIYTQVFEEDGFYSSYKFWCPKCYSLCKTNDYYENQAKALIVDLEEYGNVKKIAEYSNKILIISKNMPIPKKELFKKELSIGKRVFKNYKKWINNIEKVNNEFFMKFIYRRFL
jgi:hypothetical protein